MVIDPAELTPDERLRELGALLAAGVLRMRQRRVLASESLQQEPPETAPKVLELSGTSRLSVTTG